MNVQLGSGAFVEGGGGRDDRKKGSWSYPYREGFCLRNVTAMLLVTIGFNLGFYFRHGSVCQK
ncbi:hypothetical protein ABT56_14540 [Photobacterium aquae]|uniref:Uncharacterized protein n=1 Tax=Photobacterium aquae TaxID=1195763 RepID=A0A0J1GY47_9GAMM|nr:hypothetical protein ABT56_14540 [Photobacterium aquae]